MALSTGRSLSSETNFVDRDLSSAMDSVRHLLNKWALIKCDWCRIVRTTEGKFKESLVMTGIQNQSLSSEVEM